MPPLLPPPMLPPRGRGYPSCGGGAARLPRSRAAASSSMMAFRRFMNDSMVRATASRPVMISLLMISGSVSTRASSNSFLALVRSKSRHIRPCASRHTNRLEYRRISRYSDSASRRTLSSRGGTSAAPGRRRDADLTLLSKRSATLSPSAASCSSRMRLAACSWMFAAGSGDGCCCRGCRSAVATRPLHSGGLKVDAGADVDA
mmetsp:Transcript_23127/g.68751  ORF Transcript_23127/g.68751 Transcript_23127/m.68751 type:complete len:203 (+) Transcript_23127:543-1151(+)